MNKFDWFFFIGLALWLAETWHFGWNDTPHSVQEKCADIITAAFMIYGFIGGIVEAHRPIHYTEVTIQRSEIAKEHLKQK